MLDVVAPVCLILFGIQLILVKHKCIYTPLYLYFFHMFIQNIVYIDMNVMIYRTNTSRTNYRYTVYTVPCESARVHEYSLLYLRVRVRRNALIATCRAGCSRWRRADPVSVRQSPPRGSCQASLHQGPACGGLGLPSNHSASLSLSILLSFTSPCQEHIKVFDGTALDLCSQREGPVLGV